MVAATKSGLVPEADRKSNGFRSRSVLLEEIPQMAGIRIRVEIHVASMRRAAESEPARDSPEHRQWRTDSKSAVATLEDDFPAMVLLMEMNDELALSGLALLARHSPSMEMRLAAEICLERAPSPQSREASSASLSAQGPGAP